MKFLVVVDVILGILAFAGRALISLPFKILAALFNLIGLDAVAAVITGLLNSVVFQAIFGILKLPFIVLTAILIIWLLLKLIKGFIAKRRAKKEQEAMYANANMQKMPVNFQSNQYSNPNNMDMFN